MSIAKIRFLAIIILVVGALLGYFVYASEFVKGSFFSGFPFRLGLDLKGGVQLVYKADVSTLQPADARQAMIALRDVIERRVNVFGVTEPVIQVEEKSTADGLEERLVVELPGLVDVAEAIKMIGATPNLEFKTERPEAERELILKEQKLFKEKQEAMTATTQIDLSGINMELVVKDPYYIDSLLTGRYLKKASLSYDQYSPFPSVSIEFNSDGEKLFAELTKNNVGKTIAIYLDNQPISTPMVKEEIKSGSAQITGNFGTEEARRLVRDLNLGALPVAIGEPISKQAISAPLGQKLLEMDVWAGIWGTLLVALFLLLWYRLPGLIAVVSLSIYIIIILTIFKMIPVTITAAGIAGFIMSVGMAVDANILIFERTKEELRAGRTIADAIKEGFDRAWLSIRDSNTSSMITASVLFWLGTSLVRGFALTFGLGVLVSMFTAITVTRIFLYSFRYGSNSALLRFLFSNGLTK